MRKIVITKSLKETQSLGKEIALNLKNGGIVCLSGDLGAGKTTFAQGLLKGLKVKGPYTSPTFLIMKHYQKEITKSKNQITNKAQNTKHKTQNIYHIDAYRVGAKDVLNIGWEEIVADKNNVIIIEWAERIKKIISKQTLWIKFEWIDENKRKIIIK